MFNPFINLFSHVIDLVNLALIVWLVLDLLMHFDIVNRFNPLVRRIHGGLGRFLEPLLRPLRRFLTRYLPALGGLDLSPLLLMLLLGFVKDAAYSWFYQF